MFLACACISALVLAGTQPLSKSSRLGTCTLGPSPIAARRYTGHRCCHSSRSPLGIHTLYTPSSRLSDLHTGHSPCTYPDDSMYHMGIDSRHSYNLVHSIWWADNIVGAGTHRHDHSNMCTVGIGPKWWCIEKCSIASPQDRSMGSKYTSNHPRTPRTHMDFDSCGCMLTRSMRYLANTLPSHTYSHPTSTLSYTISCTYHRSNCILLGRGTYPHKGSIFLHLDIVVWKHRNLSLQSNHMGINIYASIRSILYHSSSRLFAQHIVHFSFRTLAHRYSAHATISNSHLHTELCRRSIHSTQYHSCTHKYMCYYSILAHLYTSVAYSTTILSTPCPPNIRICGCSSSIFFLYCIRCTYCYARESGKGICIDLRSSPIVWSLGRLVYSCRWIRSRYARPGRYIFGLTDPILCHVSIFLHIYLVSMRYLLDICTSSHPLPNTYHSYTVHNSPHPNFPSYKRTPYHSNTAIPYS